MIDILTEQRNRILFPAKGEDFLHACIQVREELRGVATQGDIQPAAEAAAELAADLRSFLIEWKLLPYVNTGVLTTAAIDAESDAFLALARELGGDKAVEAARCEIESIAHSSMKQLAHLYAAGKLNSYWGHDYASGIAHSLRRGACFSTNNPCKNTLFKKDFPELYHAMLTEIAREAPDASLEDKVSLLFVKICARHARALLPIFECTNEKYGFFCVQVNPFNIPNADSTRKIIEQVEFWQEAFKKELGVERPNVVYKIPAAESGVEAAKHLSNKGYRLCVTLNFTVAQHEIFAEILSKAKVPGFVVLMGGLLDDKVAADLKALNMEDSAALGRHAAQAVIRKSYANLRAKGYDKYASIMTAAVRGPWAISNTLAPMGGAPSCITTLTAKINEFDDAAPLMVSAMDEPIDPQIMNALMKSKVFRQAYATLDEQAWQWDSLFSFPPFVAFYDQFREAYAELTEDVRTFNG